MLAVVLIILGVVSAVSYHPQNFTAVIAVALFAGTYLPRRQALVVPLALYLIKDIFLGFHALVFYTWGSILAIAWLGMWLKERKSFSTITLCSVFSALFYYIVTNFAVWLHYPTYPKTIAGLTQCYVAALPFFRMSLLSTVLYVTVLFGIYEFACAKLKNTRLAFVL